MTNHDGADHCESCGHVILTDGVHIHNGSANCAGAGETL